MLLCLTANHRNANFETLERLSIGAPDAAEALVSSSNVVAGAVVLATCNRFEAYLDVSDSVEAVDQTVAAMSRASGVTADALREVVTVLEDAAAVRHLFAVSSGLESVVVGEDEISGQVRRALERARTARTTTSVLEQVFQKATETSRWVKTRTAIGGAGRSLVRLALELASSRVADWAATRVLIVGTGQYAATTVAALRDLGVETPHVFSPSGRGGAFAVKYGLLIERNLAAAIADSDVVITCTTSNVIGPSVITDSKRRLIIDLGLPRNVDHEVANCPGVELLDLETISIHAPLEELSATSDARAIIGSAATRFAVERSAEPGIVAMRSHILELLDSEIERARRRGDDDGTTESALRHFAGVLLHDPSVRARELAANGRAEDFTRAIETMFGIVPAPGTEPDDIATSA